MVFGMTTALATTARAQEPNESKSRHSAAAVKSVSQEARALAKLHEINLEEIAVGGLAKTKATSDAAKQYADTLVTDHTALDQRVVTLADQKGIELAAQKDKRARRAEQKHLTMLRKLDTARFDHGFAKMMADGHAKAADAIRDYQKSVTDSDVKALLSDALPSIEAHQKTAESIMATAAH
jgi:putative membrane protein